MPTPRKGGFVHILYWILGINLVMVVVGLLGEYIFRELVVCGDEEPMSVFVWLYERAQEAVDENGLLGPAWILVGPVALIRAFLFFIYFWPRRRRFQYQSNTSSLDDTQELPTTGFYNT